MKPTQELRTVSVFVSILSWVPVEKSSQDVNISLFVKIQDHHVNEAHTRVKKCQCFYVHSILGVWKKDQYST